MKNLIKSMEGLIQTSKDMFLRSSPRPQNWKICVLLGEEGWKSKVEYINESTDILIHWNKGEKTQTIRLTMEDQYMWVKSTGGK